MTDDTDTHSNGNADAAVKTIIRMRTRKERPSHSVIEAVAEMTGTDPVRMQPLFDTIDPEALNELFRRETNSTRRPPNGRVTFEYGGCEVAVHADGRTVVSRRNGSDGSATGTF